VVGCEQVPIGIGDQWRLVVGWLERGPARASSTLEWPVFTARGVGEYVQSPVKRHCRGGDRRGGREAEVMEWGSGSRSELPSRFSCPHDSVIGIHVTASKWPLAAEFW
jgi:hypothetical protein